MNPMDVIIILGVHKNCGMKSAHEFQCVPAEHPRCGIHKLHRNDDVVSLPFFTFSLTSFTIYDPRLRTTCLCTIFNSLTSFTMFTPLRSMMYAQRLRAFALVFGLPFVNRLRILRCLCISSHSLLLSFSFYRLFPLHLFARFAHNFRSSPIYPLLTPLSIRFLLTFYPNLKKLIETSYL